MTELNRQSSSPDRPPLTVSLGDRDHTVEPSNTALYTYMGHYAMYDHVYLIFGETSGTAIFKEFYPEPFSVIKTYIEAHRLPQHINLVKPFDVDMKAFEETLESLSRDELDSGIPKDWQI